MKAYLISESDKKGLILHLSLTDEFKKDPKFKKCSFKVGEVLVLPTTVSYRETNGVGKFTLRERNARRDRITRDLSLDEAAKLDKSSLRYSREVYVVFKYTLDHATGEIETFGKATDINNLEFVSIRLHHNGRNSIRRISDFVKAGDLYVQDTQFLQEFIQKDIGLSIYVAQKDVGPRRNFTEALGFEKTDNIIPLSEGNAEVHFMGYGMNPHIYIKGRESSISYNVRKNLVENVKRHIQYNHIGASHWLAYGSLTTRIFDSCVSATDLEFDNFCFRVNNTLEGKHFLTEKPDRLVPKNGEKNAGERVMKFRTDFANVLMAMGATKLYAAINVDPRNLGTRIVDDQIVPYIYTYNLYTRDCEGLANKYKYCRYLDISDFFNSISYSLIEEASLALVNDSQKAGVLTALSSIRKAMLCNGGKNCLTIDSNYEHAVATIVMAYLMSKTAIEHRTFVDDTLLFSDNEGTLDIAIERISAELHKHGLSFNPKKSYRFSGDYLADLKKLVFLPTGLRYRVDEAFTDIRLIGFEEFLKHNVRPETNAFSSVDSLRKAFSYEEARWTVANYKRLCTTDYSHVVVTSANILEVLQHYTIRQQPLTGEEICRLVIIGEEFPSKWKWIISILNEADAKMGNILKYHRMEYVRYLVTGQLVDSHVIYKPVAQSVFVSNQKELDTVLQIIAISRRQTGASLNFDESLTSLETRAGIVVSYNKDVYQTLDGNVISASLKNNKFMPETYPFELWRLLVAKGLNLYCDGLIT